MSRQKQQGRPAADWAKLEASVGYRFHNISLLKNAMTLIGGSAPEKM